MEISKRKYDGIIVGGGIVGAATAYFAAGLGAEILLVDRAAVGQGCTRAGAGLIVPSHNEPAANPGNILMGLKSFFSRHSPISIRPRLNDGWIRWMMRFVRTGLSPREISRSREVLLELNRQSMGLHLELSKNGGQEYSYHSDGFLIVFRTAGSFKQAIGQAREDKRWGITSVLLDGRQVNEFEPWIDARVAGGLYYPEDAHLAPQTCARWMADTAARKGAAILTGAEVFAFGGSDSRTACILTTKGEFRADQVVLAAGSWMADLTRQLGQRLPIKGAKGYSLTFPRQKEMPGRPILLEDEHMVLVPYPDRLRLTGGWELCGIDNRIRPEFLEGMAPIVRSYSSRFLKERPVEIRMGHRPISADGLPLVGRMEKAGRVLIAGGHGQEGLTQGPLAGKQIADLLSGGSIGALGQALDPNRFF